MKEIDKEKIIELYTKENKTYREISKIVGISHVSVGKIIKDNKINPEDYKKQSTERKYKNCLHCKKEFTPEKNTRKYCSRACADDAKRKEGLEKRKISGNRDRNGLIPEEVKNLYKRKLKDKYDYNELVSHARWHYNKGLFSIQCNMCIIDNPNINLNENKWKTLDSISNKLNIKTIEINRLLVKNGLKNKKGHVTSKARSLNSLYCIQPTKYANDDLWDYEKIRKLYDRES